MDYTKEIEKVWDSLVEQSEANSKSLELLIQVNEQLQATVDRQNSIINHLNCLLNDYSIVIGEMQRIDNHVIIERIKNCAHSMEEPPSNFLRIV